MAPKEWRESVNLKLEDVAARLKRAGVRRISRMSVWNYETGRRDAPNSVVVAYGKISDNRVTADDLHSVRRGWLRAQPKAAA